MGVYFFFAAFNRMIELKSKLGLAEWYKSLAVHQVRLVDIFALNSRRYW